MKATTLTGLPRVTTGSTRRTVSRLSIALALAAGAALTAPVAEARITRIEISQSSAFEGRVFGPSGGVGAYEKLRGKAHGEVDPADPRNALITDIELAPRTAGGKVAYSMDIYILKPVDLNKGNHKLFMEVNNRGGKLFGNSNGSTGGNNPTTAADAGDAFLMHQGYSLAWNGWDISAAPGGDRLTIPVPGATNPGGATITGPSYEYIVFDNNTTTSSTLAYPAATLDKAQAALTVRAHLTDPPVPVPADGWEYTSDGTAIRLLPVGTRFQQSAIYEFTYVAKNPVVAGLGLAATRDFVSFLRYATADDFGHPNPLAGHVHHTYAFTVSQPARYLNDFQTLGFNEDEAGRRVIDGILNWLGGGNGVGINFRFAQTARTERNRQNHRYPEATSPLRTLRSQTRTRGRREVAAFDVPQPTRVPKPWR
jgi:Alpha/beta hydrolase domain